MLCAVVQCLLLLLSSGVSRFPADASAAPSDAARPGERAFRQRRHQLLRDEWRGRPPPSVSGRETQQEDTCAVQFVHTAWAKKQNKNMIETTPLGCKRQIYSISVSSREPCELSNSRHETKVEKPLIKEERRVEKRKEGKNCTNSKSHQEYFLISSQNVFRL